MLFARMVYYEEIWERSATKAKEWRRNDRKGLQLFIYNREYWVLLGESRAAYIDKKEYLHKERHKTKKGRRKSEAPSRSHSQYLIKERKKMGEIEISSLTVLAPQKIGNQTLHQPVLLRHAPLKPYHLHEHILIIPLQNPNPSS